LITTFTINANFVTVFSSVASIWTVVLFGLIGSIISQLGDLFASFIKRRARVKDYGTSFPGHGGIMDRFDGMIFNSAFVMLYILILL
jgi:phosphatidate cytidylyltransferase